MTVLSDQSIFAAMKQDGPFAVRDSVSIARPFSPARRAWVKSLRSGEVETTKYRAVRGQIFNLLQIEQFSEIDELLRNEALRKVRGQRAYSLLGNLFSIDGDSHLVVTKMREFAATADSVINYLRNRVLWPYAAHIEIANEIETTSNPVDLLLILFDDRYHKKVRFEAKRKLVLMHLAGAIDQRERETNIERNFSSFLRFLNDHVWSPNLKIGEHRSVYLLSDHDIEDFRCTKVEVIGVGTAKGLRLGPGQKLTFVNRRMFRDGSREIPIYVSVRKKSSDAKVLKLLRKNEKNPAVAVEDELGLMAVLDGRNQVKRFVAHLTRAALKARSFMTLEDISDTLSSGGYRSGSIGSSEGTQMMKFFARLGGIRVEFIIHTNQSYLNYRFQHGISHDEYEVKRIFDSGVSEFLFPMDVYRLDMDEIRERQLEYFRRREFGPG